MPKTQYVDIDRLRKLVNLGWSQKRIAEAMGVSEQTIMRRLAGLGIKTPSKR
jgi:transcriptional regulator with XRE-family HTH domain